MLPLCFPYVCPLCDGAFRTCARRRALSRLTSSSSSTLMLDDDVTHGNDLNEMRRHQTCHGGRECYESEVCVTSGSYAFCDPSATYDGKGRVSIDHHHTVMWRGQGIEFWCRSCFMSNENRDFSRYLIHDSQFIRKRRTILYLVLGLKLGIPDEVISHHIVPYLLNCTHDRKRFDCLLCQVDCLSTVCPLKPVTTSSVQRLQLGSTASSGRTTEKNQRRSMKKKDRKRKKART